MIPRFWHPLSRVRGPARRAIQKNWRRLDLLRRETQRAGRLRLIAAGVLPWGVTNACLAHPFRSSTGSTPPLPGPSSSPSRASFGRPAMRSRFAHTMEEELGERPEWRARLQSPFWRDFLQLTEELVGLPRHLSQHSGGVIISTTRIDEQV